MTKTFIRILTTSLMFIGVFGISFPAHADYLSSRSAILSNNLPSTVASYTLGFTTGSTASIGSIRFQFCTNRFGACDVPVGLDTMSASILLQDQFGMGSFSMQQPSQGELVLVRSAQPVLAGERCYYTFSGLTNPSFSNVSFYVRMDTYSSDDGTGASIDSGAAVISINSALTVEGITPETLSFCIGITGNSCSDLHGQLVGFGDFSPVATAMATTVMFAATNAPGGYVITIHGSPMASGTNIIPNMGDQSLDSAVTSPSAVGTSQFGTNLAANTVPAVGSNTSGVGLGSARSNYGTPNQFRFFAGDTIASAPQNTEITKYTNSYIVNIAKNQPIGFYTATLSYICTGSF